MFGMEAVRKHINVTLDDEHARKLAELAAERHVEEIELAGDEAGDAGPDVMRVASLTSAYVELRGYQGCEVLCDILWPCVCT